MAGSRRGRIQWRRHPRLGMRLGVRFAALSRSTRQTPMLAMKLHARFVQGGQQLQALIGQMLGNRILGHKPVRMNQRNMAPASGHRHWPQAPAGTPGTGAAGRRAGSCAMRSRDDLPSQACYAHAGYSTRWPVRRWTASAYLRAVASMTCAGTRGPGACLFQSRVSR